MHNFLLDDGLIVIILNRKGNDFMPTAILSGTTPIMPAAANITKQMMRIQKTLLNNTFEAQTLLQEQGERAARAILDRAVWMPDAGRPYGTAGRKILKQGAPRAGL